MNALAAVGRATWRLFSSFGLSVAIVVFLGVLTWLGTLAQVHESLYDVQKRYFEGWFLVHHQPIGRDAMLAIPLPGGTLLLSLLTVNLLVGGLWRLRRRKHVGGVAVVHVGILILLAAGLVKMRASQEGHTSLYEGESKDYFQSYHEHELVVLRPREEGRVEERTLAARALHDATPDAPVRVRGGDLPFDLEVTHWIPNASGLPKGPMFDVAVPVVDGFFLREERKAKENEQNLPGAYVEVVGKDGSRQRGVLWLANLAPWTFEVAGERFALDLRRERYPLPFTVRLDDFQKEDHPRTGLPRWFSSDVTVLRGDETREVTISMNQPLRSDGLVFYQASWGPSDAKPGDPLFSTLAVVRNPSDQWPLIGCIVIAAGLLWHFGRKLLRYLKREATPA